MPNDERILTTAERAIHGELVKGARRPHHSYMARPFKEYVEALNAELADGDAGREAIRALRELMLPVCFAEDTPIAQRWAEVLAQTAQWEEEIENGLS